MHVDLYADLVCPWCYIGTANLRRAVARLDAAEPVIIRIRSFQLDRHAPTAPRPLGETLTARYGAHQVPAMLRSVAERGVEAGLCIDLDPHLSLSGNTLAAHRVLQAGWSAGRQIAVADALFRAYFGRRESLFDPLTLRRIGIEAGLAPEQVDAALQDATFAELVAEDGRTAAALGITAVPFLVIDGVRGIAGAQPVPVLSDLLEQSRQLSVA